MQLRPPASGLLILGISCLVAGLAAGCSQSGSPGQHSTSPGQQAVSLQQLENPVTGAAFNGEDASAGAIDPVLAWVGGPRRQVTVESASLIALPGYRLPRLTYVGAVPGCVGSSSVSANDAANNTVSVTVNDRAVQLIPIHGYQLRTGNSKCVPVVVYEVQDNVPGQFAVAGLKLDVLSGGRTGSVIAYDGDFVWYVTSASVPTNSQYNARFNAASAAHWAYWQARSTSGS